MLELEEAGCCCPHALPGGVVSVPRTCVALFLSLLVRCYVSTVVYVTLVYFVLLYPSVSYSYRRRVDLRWPALLDLALNAAARPASPLHAMAPLRQRPRTWQIRISLAERSAHLRSGDLARRRAGVARSGFIACRRCFRFHLCIF